MNRMTIVYHMATPRSDGRIAVTRVGKICRDGVVVSTMTHSVTLTSEEARRMAKAMRDDFGRFLKEDGDSTVEVWCETYEAFLWLEEHEAFQITWTRKGGAEVHEDFCCHESGGDGWSWEFSQALEDAASEVEASE